MKQEVPYEPPTISICMNMIVAYQKIGMVGVIILKYMIKMQKLMKNKKIKKHTIPIYNNFCFRKTTFYYHKIMYNNLKICNISKKIMSEHGQNQKKGFHRSV